MVESKAEGMEVDEAAGLQINKSDSMQFSEFTQAEMDSLNQKKIKQYESDIAEKSKETGTVSVKDFKTLKVIGKGSYGKVLLVEKIDTKKIYALKVLKKKEILKRNQYEHTMEERRILVSNSRKPNVAYRKA